MKPKKFKAELIKMGSWVVAVTSFNTVEVFGIKKNFRAKGSIDGYPVIGIAMMPRGDGTHIMPVKKEIRTAIGKDFGDSVEFILEKDDADVVIPRELIDAFEASEEAKKMFDSYSYSIKKQYSQWIGAGKKKEVRENRAVKTVIRLEKLFYENQK